MLWLWISLIVICPVIGCVVCVMAVPQPNVLIAAFGALVGTAASLGVVFLFN